MFKSNDDKSSNSQINSTDPETIIGASVKVEGNFKGDGNVVIEGEVKGSIKTKKDVRVGESAKINASIDSANAFIAGEVNGNIKVKEKLELSATAKITGDITAKTLQTNDGATINGLIKMEAEHLTPATAMKKEISEEKNPEKEEKKK